MRKCSEVVKLIDNQRLAAMQVVPRASGPMTLSSIKVTLTLHTNISVGATTTD